MPRTESLEDLVQRGQELSSHDEPLAAWNGQQSTRNERFHVIFKGKVYYNTEWVDSGQRPGDINETEANPWKYERDATQQEMARLGNPTSDSHLHEHPHPLKGTYRQPVGTPQSASERRSRLKQWWSRGWKA